MSAPSECPEIASWPKLLGDAVPPDQWERCERHLESCVACQERLHRAEGLWGGLGTLGRRLGDPTLGPPDPTLTQVRERLYGIGAPAQAPPQGPPDLHFLRPSDRPGVLGTLGEYEVRGVIGQGGMGVVLQAYDPALHRLVAIKVLAPQLAASPSARRRFTREARAAAAVCHEHVVAVYGVAETGGLPYLVMQYVAGESLQDRLDRAGPLGVEEVVRIGLQTAQGLAAAHAQGLIHRDVKPANLLLEEGVARVKVSDFGLARTADDAGLTQQGVVAGTPEYMAPEQARGEAVDHRADLFSLGSVLYACCTGRPPFRGPSTLAVLHQVSEQVPAPAHELNPDVPAWLERFIARLLAKEADDRLQSAAEAAALLEGYLAHLQQPATVPAPELPPVRSPSNPRSSAARVQAGVARATRRRLWLPALVLLAVVVLPLFLLRQAPPQGQQPLREFYQDFRGAGPLPPAFTPVGGDEVEIRREDEGLRITVPATRQRRDPAGVVAAFDLQGDFEITTGYEILQADRPQAGHGVGFELCVTTATPRKSNLSFSRLLRLKEGDVYWATRMTVGDDDKEHYEQGWVPAAARSGQLRLIRTGEEVTFWAAEGADGPFQQLFERHVGPERLETVRLAAFPGWAPNPVNVRVKDLRVRSLGAEAVHSATAAPVVPPSGRPKAWGALAVAVGFVIALAVGLWLSVRRSGRARPLPAGAPVPGPTNEPAPASHLTFACPGCGKKLKSRADLAGKHVKCPQCGGAALVPSLQAGGPGGTA